MPKFTVFIVENYASGTTWIGTVEAVDIETAKNVAIEQAANDWGYSVDDVSVLGVAAGDVEILEWEDE